MDPEAVVGPEEALDDPMGDIAAPEGTIDGFGMQMKMGRDGSISIAPGRDRAPVPPDAPPPRDRRGGDEGDEE